LQRKGVAPLAPRTRHLPPKLGLGKRKTSSMKNNAVWDKIEQMSFEIEDLKHKEIGYRAVISYLQARLDGNAEL
jgi:hypothetical protein